MSARSRIFGALLALGCVANAAWCVADDSWLWGASGERTTYSPPYDPSDAPTIPLLKRSESVGDKTSGQTGAGPRVGDSGTFVGTDGKTYYYRFVEGVRRRAVVETRPDASSPNGWRKVWRYVDEPRLIKQIWPVDASTIAPEPCRPVENVVETANAAGPTQNEPTILYRATVRAVVR